MRGLVGSEPQLVFDPSVQRPLVQLRKAGPPVPLARSVFAQRVHSAFRPRFGESPQCQPLGQTAARPMCIDCDHIILRWL